MVTLLVAFRSLLLKSWVRAAAIFIALALALPHLIAMLTTEHYSGAEHARMHVAVKSGERSFYLYPTGVPSTLDREPFLADGDISDSPGNPDVPAGVRVVSRSEAGVLMETVRMLDYATVTSRYLVAGRQLSPISQMSLNPLNRLLGTLIAAAIALACRTVLAQQSRSDA